MRPILATFLIVPLVVPAAGGLAQRPITKTEIRAERPERTHARLRSQFWRLFEVEDMRSDAPPQQALDRAWLNTTVRATEVPSLCRFDRLAIEFAPLHPRDRGAETPVRASGFTSTSHFRFLAPPAGLYTEVADDDLAQDDPRCRRLDRDRDTFFVAEDAGLANDGYFTLLGLRQALRDRRPLDMDCQLQEPGVTCPEAILTLDPDATEEIAQCDPRPSDGAWCYRLTIGFRSVDIYTSAHSLGPPFGTVVGTRISSLIVMSHRRPD